MIFWNIKNSWQYYALRGGILFLSVLFMVEIYQLVGMERLCFVAELLSDRMPLTLKFVSWQNILTNEENFYSIFLVLYQVWLGYTLMRDTKEIFEEDRKTGRVYYFANQLVSKGRYFDGKMLVSGINFILMLSIYYIGLFLMGLLSGCFLSGEGLTGYLFRTFAAYGILVAVEILWLAVKKSVGEDCFESVFLLGTIFLGNIHRLLTVLITVLQLIERNGGMLYRMRRVLMPLYWISPVSWLDPFHNYKASDTGIIFGMGIVVMVLCCCLAHLCYRRKEIIG